jgi:predicted RNase H-like nuclease (RuvC/YqgF family)
MERAEVELVISHLKTLQNEIERIQRGVENLTEEISNHAVKIAGLEREISFLRQDLRNRKILTIIKWTVLPILFASGGYTIKDVLKFFISSF